jgi:hypothetical protein
MVDGRSGRHHPRRSGHLGARVRRGTGRGEQGDLVYVLTGHGDEELRLEFGRWPATSTDRSGLGLRLTEALRGEGRAARTGGAGASWLGRIHGGGCFSRWAAGATNRPRRLPSRSPGEEGVRKRRVRGSRLCRHRARGQRTPTGTWSAVGDELGQGRIGTSLDVGAPARDGQRGPAGLERFGQGVGAAARRDGLPGKDVPGSGQRRWPGRGARGSWRRRWPGRGAGRGAMVRARRDFGTSGDAGISRGSDCPAAGRRSEGARVAGDVRSPPSFF